MNAEGIRRIPMHTCGGCDDGDEPRVETGPVQFGDDWPGLFVRGDDAMYLAASIRTLLKYAPAGPSLDAIHVWHLKDIADLIENRVRLSPGGRDR